MQNIVVATVGLGDYEGYAMPVFKDTANHNLFLFLDHLEQSGRGEVASVQVAISPLSTNPHFIKFFR